MPSKDVKSALQEGNEASKEAENASKDAALTSKPVKKRTTDPGVRVQGGRIYDSKTGTTCHQCRQKTVEVKAKCGNCTMFFCPRCLLNRYGEEVDKVNLLAHWKCPKCRDICNCSNCRKKRGLEATGILANMSKAAGFTSVSDLLQKNPNAKRPPSASLQGPGAKVPKEASGEAKPKAQKKKKEEPKLQDAPELLDDELLGPRPQPLPEREAVRMHRVPDEASDVRWPPDLADRVDLPPDCNAGDLAEVLEFLKVFGEQTGTASVSLSFAAVELLQPATEAGHSAYAREERSVAGHIHMRLLDLVRSDWGIRDSVGIHGWQPVMKQYLRQDRLHGLAALDKLSGGAGGGNASAAAAQLPEDRDGDEGVASPGAVVGAAGCDGGSGGEGEDPLLAFPPGGYWALQPGARLHMLRSLCFDALETRAIRQCMEDAMDAAAELDKGRREELAAAKREAREAWQKQRDKEIALLLAGGNGAGLTIEEQRALMDKGWAKVDATAAAAAAGQLPASGAPTAFPAAMRIIPLGSDRSRALFWKLACCPVLAGGAQAAVLMASEFRTADSDEWSVCPDAAALAQSLDGRGRREATLLRSLEAAYAGCTAKSSAGKTGAAAAKTGAAAKRGTGKTKAAKSGAPDAAAITGSAAGAAKTGPAAKTGSGKSKVAKSGVAKAGAPATTAAKADAKAAVSSKAGTADAATAAAASAGAQKGEEQSVEAGSQDAAAAASVTAKAKPGRKRAVLAAVNTAAAPTAEPSNGAAEAVQEPAGKAAGKDGAAAEAKPRKRQKRGVSAEHWQLQSSSEGVPGVAVPDQADVPVKRVTRSRLAA